MLGHCIIKRISLLGFATFVVIGCGPASAQQARFDILLKGGHVIDPANEINGRRDVAIAGDRIAAVEEQISEQTARRVIDVSDHFVTPGFIDLHAHAKGSRIAGAESIPPSMHFASGATTIVDAGTWGALDFPIFRKTVIERTPIRVLAFLNIVSRGMAAQATGSFEQSVDLMDPDLCAATISENRDVLIGVKTAHYWTAEPWDDAHPPWAAVERAVAAGRIADVPVMVDFWPRPPERPYEELILEKLRPGDIHTHVFAQQFRVLDENGTVQDYMHRARARGVLFDLGHGAGSFWFRNAAPAVAQGFVPDTISTDLHMGNVNGPVVDFITTMSKILALGVPLEDVVRRATINPARAIRRPELGTLSVGSEADVAVVERLRGRFGYTDCGRAKMIGNVKLENRLTLRSGRIVFDPTGLSMVEWQKAPPRYFTTPRLQGVDPTATAEPDAE